MSANITDMINSRYVPTMALVLYEEESKPGVLNHHGDAAAGQKYFESHQIDKDGRMLEGRPLHAETLAGIAQIYNEHTEPETFDDLFPECLLSFEPAWFSREFKLLWWRPAGKQYLHFATELCIPSGEAPVPAMLFWVTKNRLHVFALGSDERPTSSALLFNAPFYNVNSKAEVCLGSAKTAKAKRSYQSQIDYWETLFWKSKFTQLQNQKIVKGNLNLIWKGLLEGTSVEKWADLDILLPSPVKTIKDLFKQAQ